MARRRAVGGFSVVADAVRTQLWPVPVLGVLVAVVLGVEVPRLDAAYDRGLPAAISAVLFGGGPDAARTVLSAIASSLITVTSLTFSLTVVTLQLASGQYSPRLLRTFSRDRFVHATLALFLGTFVYSLVALRTVRDSGSDQPGFVPRVAVTLAVAVTVASVVGLVLFLAHLARQIRVESVLQTVHDEAEVTLRRTLQPRNRSFRATELVPPPPEVTQPVLAAESGFLVSVDEDDLLEAARATGTIVSIGVYPGSSIVAGTPIGRCWTIDGEPADQQQSRDLNERIGGAVNVGPERTAAQDIAFGLRQLTDVANKALSPGINDPTTAVHALGHVAALLCDCLDYDLGPRLLRDDHDRVRVVLDRPDFGDLLDTGVSQPRRYGSSSPEVLARIAQLLQETGWRTTRAADRAAVKTQAERLQRTVDAADMDGTDRRSLHTAIESVRGALDHQ